MIGLKSVVRRLVVAATPGALRLIRRCPWLKPFALTPEQIAHIPRVLHHWQHKAAAVCNWSQIAVLLKLTWGKMATVPMRLRRKAGWAPDWPDTSGARLYEAAF